MNNFLLIGAAIAGIYFLNKKQDTINGFFDDVTINTLDELKKEYFKLAKIYHPDKGGSTADFQALQNEYEKLFKQVLKGSKLSPEEKQTETEIDENLRAVIDSIIHLQGINIELIGKWIWISGNTFAVKDILKAANFIFIKKAGVPFWVYKGAESTGRGKMSLEAIKNKYGSTKFSTKGSNYISGIPQVAIYLALKKLQKSLKHR
jgi:hypothetical protein